jgi:hypothetical protein
MAGISGKPSMTRLLPLLVLAACTPDLPPRPCTTDTQCLQSGAPGTCLPSPASSQRFCVFPSVRCSAGAYGLLAGDGLAGTCYQGTVAAADAPAGARLALGPDDADFGIVVAGMTSPDAVFTVTNQGVGASRAGLVR